MNHRSFGDLFNTLWTASGRTRTALTVEVFGWLVLLEGAVMLLAPQLVVSWLQLPATAGPAENYLRLLGLLVGGVGLLYVVSGRLSAEGFAFASLLDHPLVPPIMALLWWMGLVPGSLALMFALQDFGSFLWTLFTWRAERRTARA